MKNRIIKLSFSIRVFLVKLFLNLNKKLGYIKIREKHLYYKSKNIKVKTLVYGYKHAELTDNLKSKMSINTPCGYYDWSELIEDIKLNGIKNNITVIVGRSETDPEYIVIDGHHRLKSLEIIHGKESDIEIKADIYVHFNYLIYLKLLKKNKIDLAKKRIEELNNKLFKFNTK